MSVLKCVAILVALATLAAGCGESEPASPEVAKLKRPAIPTQEVRAPCDWLPAPEAERILGTFARAPSLIASAENPRPDNAGRACLYVIRSSDSQVSEVALEISLAGASTFEFAMDMMGQMFAQELNEGHGSAPEPKARTDGWDYVSPFPELTVWRIGHVAVAIGDKSLRTSTDRLEGLALAIRERIKDTPFAMPDVDPNLPAEGPDPCALLTRAEAEEVLGKLVVEPYRSIENASIAESDGRSCSYYTAGHRVLVITPAYTDGQSTFETEQGVSGFLRFAVGGSDPTDLLEGSWDASASAGDGSVLFLKGDALLRITFQTSSTDIAGAGQLAEVAIGRLASLSAAP